MCKITILYNLDEYPIQTLLLLPRSIRQKLYLGLSPANVLHYERTGLFNDVDVTDLIASGRLQLLDIVLSNQIGNEFVVPVIMPALKCEDQFAKSWPWSLSNTFMKHICTSYSYLPFTEILTHQRCTLLVPKRVLSFVSIEWQSSGDDKVCDLKYSPLEQLLQYCNFMTAPKVVKIDVCYFTCTQFWKEFYENFRTKGLEQYTSTIDRNVKMDPVLPFIQNFLSTVEKFELGTSGDPINDSNLDEEVVMVSYILLYNIITSQQPHLKHLEVYGIPMVVDMILNNVKKLCSDCENRSPFSPNSLFQVVLATHAPPPYLLKSLSVSPEEPDRGYSFEYMTNSYTSVIAASIKDIVLEHVSIHGVGFCYGPDFKYSNYEDRMDHSDFGKRDCNVPEYCSLLSTLADLLKQPQLQSLNVGKSPLPETYQMIEIFLCTEITHQQSLAVIGIEEEGNTDDEETDNESDYGDDVNEENSDNEHSDNENTGNENKEQLSDENSSADERSSRKKVKISSSITPPLHSPPAQPLPDSNGTLKSLDIGSSSRFLHDWLVSIPNLQLKELKTSRPSLVEGVSFPVTQSYITD